MIRSEHDRWKSWTMKYDRVITGIFESRPNRFIAMVEITDPDTGNVYVCKCHVKNTMQCNKLLTGDQSL
ncbi:hypothetical protein [Methanomethylophilus alvi]|uniref:hypothetical protein n=1 Tax=Methanomethylophilus alvi TaxID=1291540 RepID=UPI0037DD65A0